MYSLLAVVLWISGWLLLPASILVGSGLLATGFLSAGAAINRPNDMPLFFGLLFLAGIGITVIRLVIWGFTGVF